MSNLGLYQDIVTAAARSGGVENLIRKIESGAVTRAAPGLFWKGAGIGVFGTLAVGGMALGARWLWSVYEETLAAAAEAKEDLRAAVDENRSPEDSHPNADERPDQTDTH